MSRNGYRIIFMGTPDFAVPSLKSLIDSDHDIVAVVTQPDKKKGRGKKFSPPPIKIIAERAGVTVLQPTKIKTAEFQDTLRSFKPDLIVVVAYGRILPAEILTLPPLGCINVHGSLLPRHRGAAPIQWAVLQGDNEAGVTIMQMDVGMDTGDILLPAAIEVDKEETAGSLFNKVAKLGAETLTKALQLLLEGKLQAISQDHDIATKAPPLKKEQGLIDWSKAAIEIHRQIRGMDPWPSAYTFLDGKRFRLFSPKVVYKTCDLSPGSILLANREGLLIATGKDMLLIRELQPEGKKRMVVESFLCGHPLQPSSQFDNS